MVLKLDRRGFYKLVSIQILSRYPFGFFQRARRYDIPGQLLVYPRLISASVGPRRAIRWRPEISRPTAKARESASSAFAITNMATPLG